MGTSWTEYVGLGIGIFLLYIIIRWLIETYILKKKK